MSEWWTHRLTSFLLFSPRTYYRLLELYNLAIWPAQLAGIAIGLAIVALLIGKRGHRERIIAGLLAACWLWIALAFHYQPYAQINWAAPWLPVGAHACLVSDAPGVFRVGLSIPSIGRCGVMHDPSGDIEQVLSVCCQQLDQQRRAAGVQISSPADLTTGRDLRGFGDQLEQRGFVVLDPF